MDGISNLEGLFSSFSGKKYGVAVNSGTSALTLAVRALNIGKGDEVIMPGFTMAATKWAVEYNDAKPVFVDVDDNLLLDLDEVGKKITSKTKAILTVDMYGRIPDVKKLLKIANKIPIIEDACEAHGGSGVGYGDIVCFSFFKNKIVHAEEGGMCLTDDKDLAERMRWLKCMAFGQGKDKYRHAEMGFNFRMPLAEAELALKSLRGYKGELKRRREIEKYYDCFLSTDKRPYRQAPWIYDIILDRDSNDLLNILWKNKIEARPFFYPFYGNNGFDKWKKGLYIQFDMNYKKAVKIINKYVRQIRQEQKKEPKKGG
jgi:dTDP-4-amino-4,6-dideoxygalactose transaminase